MAVHSQKSYTRTDLMRDIGTLDSETDPFLIGREPHPFIWGLWLGNAGGYHQFRRINEVAEFLHDKRIIVYAHNGGKFDYMARESERPNADSLLNYIAPQSQVFIINGRLARFEIGCCELRDSWNILPVPLEAYKKTKIDYSIMERDQRHKPGNWKKICDYLKDDCINLYELVQRYIANFGLNITQASGAMKFWKKMAELEAPVSDSSYFDRFAKYYYGGRVQCFERGIIDAKFQVADIKSAYPYAMLDFHPFGTDDSQIEELTGTTLRGAGIELQGFYDVEGISHGAFPHRDDSEEKLLYPADNVRRVYHVTGWELQAALDLKLLSDFKILRCWRFLELQSFKQFVQYCYDERRKAAKRLEANPRDDEARADVTLWKLLMNSLYGKFAANPRNYREFTIYEERHGRVIADLPADEHGRTERNAGMLGPWVLGEKVLHQDKQRFYNVATSASITGYVRAYLLRSMKRCKRVLYCDTDSIAAVDVSKLPFGKALGQWEIEGSFDKAAIAGRKLYAFRSTDKREGWKVRSKGVRLTYQDLVKISQGGEVEFEPTVPTFSVHHQPRFINRKVRMT